jgi:hypothetical protein
VCVAPVIVLRLLGEICRPVHLAKFHGILVRPIASRMVSSIAEIIRLLTRFMAAILLPFEPTLRMTATARDWKRPSFVCGSVCTLSMASSDWSLSYKIA